VTDLPQPGTASEMYLAAIADRLGEILARLPEPPAPPPPPPPEPVPVEPKTVELREPAASPAAASASKTSRGSGARGKGPGAAPTRPARTPRKSPSKP